MVLLTTYSLKRYKSTFQGISEIRYYAALVESTRRPMMRTRTAAYKLANNGFKIRVSQSVHPELN